MEIASAADYVKVRRSTVRIVFPNWTFIARGAAHTVLTVDWLSLAYLFCYLISEVLNEILSFKTLA